MHDHVIYESRLELSRTWVPAPLDRGNRNFPKTTQI
jgi:hypothetical protein